jgi:hypothetical protein
VTAAIASTLVVLALSNAGYWFGGREGSIRIELAAREGVGAADVAWELRLSGARLDAGRARLEAGGEPATVKFTPPTVRVRSTMRWAYRLSDPATGRELESGDVPLHVFPDDILGDVAGRVRDKRVVVLAGADEGLSARLRAAKVPHTRVDDSSALALDRPDIVLVGRDALGPAPFEQSPLLALARSGASVMLFRQSRPERVAGYPLAPRAAPRSLNWRERHPLFAVASPGPLDDLLRDGAEVTAVRLPPDEPALELAWWPREAGSDVAAGAEPAAIDALVVTKSVGKGRLVLCQLPLGDWDDDPRAQLLLAGGLDYLLTRPEPTPPPSRRRERLPAAPATVPTITIPKGDAP